jgi:polyferredoxin
LQESWLPPDLFLHLDPLGSSLAALAARQPVSGMLIGLGVTGITLLLGRVFCGYVCPLGVTLDIFQRLFGPGKKGRRDDWPPSSWRRLKYLLLALILAAALGGVNLGAWVSPLSLITRFYALLIHPLLLLAGETFLDLGYPLFSALDLRSLSYAAVEPRFFAGLYLIAGFFALLFIMEARQPRFWCRYLCPAGALLALFSFRPWRRRRVIACQSCGRCARVCPTGAITENGLLNARRECLVCQRCQSVCPVKGVSFSFLPLNQRAGAITAGENREDKLLPLSRRAFLGAAGGGILLAGAQSSGLSGLLIARQPGSIWPPGLIRPPGSLPEALFRDLCLGCGECMKVCPTNGLQPAGLAGGLEGMFSPLLRPRRGGCEPDCHACGQVCPTRAIAPLSLEEKQWAKIGTAVVEKKRCLAWAEGKQCLVCQEVCPYGAVIMEDTGQAQEDPSQEALAPVVNVSRCFGCGFCEYHCPTRLPAIMVEPLAALRLSAGGYKNFAQELGLDLRPGRLE